MKYILYTSALILALSSCNSGKFLSRKYNSGNFLENIKTIKRNGFYIDPMQTYCEANNGLSFQTKLKTNAQSIDFITSSIVKKDSIFIIKKKGRDKIIIVKNNLKNDTVYLNEELQVITQTLKSKRQKKPIDPIKEKLRAEQKIKTFSILALSLALFPILGFALSLTALKLIKKYNFKYQTDSHKSFFSMAYAALAVSIIPSLAAVAIALLIIILIFGLLFIA